MKNRKSLMKNAIALAVAVVMCMTMLPAAAFAADETPAKTINTAQDLVNFAAEVNGGKTYQGELVVLGDDIDMSGITNFVPIGTWNKKVERAFMGTFNGQGHTISGLTLTVEDSTADDAIIRAGLFGFVDGENAVVTNFTLDNAKVINRSTSNSAGSRFGNEKGESSTGIAVATLRNGTVSKITTTATCSVAGNLRTGGIVGDARSTKSKIENCTNLANVVGNNLYTGGIVGATHDVSRKNGDMGTSITGCINGAADSESKVEGTVTGTTSVGGIVGYADRANVSGCYNYAKITGSGNYGTGGIMGSNAYNSLVVLGIALVSPSHGSNIINCHNEADIVGGRAGGILGAYIVAPGEDQPKKDVVCVIKNCTNAGTVTGVENKCGAIFGYQISYKSGDGTDSVNHLIVEIDNCTFNGTIVNNALAETATLSPYTKSAT